MSTMPTFTQRPTDIQTANQGSNSIGDCGASCQSTASPRLPASGLATCGPLAKLDLQLGRLRCAIRAPSTTPNNIKKQRKSTPTPQEEFICATLTPWGSHGLVGPTAA